MLTIGIDIGTTTISAAVLEYQEEVKGKIEKKLLASKTVSNDSFVPTERKWERVQNPAVLVRDAKKLLDELLDHYSKVEAIGLTGQMHGVVYVNREGKNVSPLYTWEDGRGDLPGADGESAVSWIQKHLRIPAASGYGLVTHLYHCREKQVPVGSEKICTIADYLGMCLTGRKEPLIHAGNAASLGFYDTKAWHFQESLIAEAGMDRHILPETADEIEILGFYRGIPVTVALGDNQASFLGSVGMEKEVWQVNAGTGGQISVLSERHFEASGIEARPFLEHTWLLTGAVLCAGRAYAILEHFFRSCARAMGLEEKEQYGLMNQLAALAVRDAGGLEIDTCFQGTRTNPALRGRILGISETNLLPENLVLGVLRGIVREYYGFFQVIHEGTGLKVEKLMGSGGALRKNPALRQAFQDMFRAELALTDIPEEAACGAAVSAGMYLTAIR